MNCYLQLSALLLLQISALPATWYVRPGVQNSWNPQSPAHPIPTTGIYGAQNGTNWANAWNGLESVVWGPGGVQAGDTLYVCGEHIYTVTLWNYPSLQARIPISPAASGCIIRMDYPSDPGVIFGGAFDAYHAYSWQGPDANGVYSSAAGLSRPYGLCYEVDGTSMYRLSHTNATTWSGGLGTWYSDGFSNYVKTVAGNAPTTNIAVNYYGWRLELPTGLSNVTFQSCSFVGGGIAVDVPVYPSGPVDLNSAANNITFRSCTFRDCDANQESMSIMIPLNPGNDYWTFSKCDLGYAPSAIYAQLGYQSGTNQTRGVVGLIVTNCFIHDLDTLNYPVADGHAIGAQGNSNCIFSNNRIERTGTAIALFSYTQPMTNNLIVRNFIKDTHIHNDNRGQTGGDSIWISCGTASICPGNQVIGNITFNSGLPWPGQTWQSWMGSGISCSINDYTEFIGNTVVNADKGIYIASGVAAPNVKIVDNIVYSATNTIIRVGNLVPGTFIVDYNLYYTNATPAGAFTFLGSAAHDGHSAFADPLFVSATPSVANDFALQSGSPARGAGVAAPNWTVDRNGNALSNPPDVGALQYYAGNIILAPPSSLTLLQLP
jgi:hypothetical protein